MDIMERTAIIRSSYNQIAITRIQIPAETELESAIASGESSGESEFVTG